MEESKDEQFKRGAVTRIAARPFRGPAMGRVLPETRGGTRVAGMARTEYHLKEAPLGDGQRDI